MKYQGVQHIVIHVKTIQRKLDVSVHLHSEIEVPSESL